MDNSPFAKLSAELRNRVYELVLCPGEIKLVVDERDVFSKDPATFKIDRSFNHPLALLKSCKQINTEATKMVYALNTFVLHLDWDKDMDLEDILQDALGFIGPSNSAAIQSLIIIASDVDANRFRVRQALDLLRAEPSLVQKLSLDFGRVKISETIPVELDKTCLEASLEAAIKTIRNPESFQAVRFPRWDLYWDYSLNRLLGKLETQLRNIVAEREEESRQET